MSAHELRRVVRERLGKARDEHRLALETDFAGDLTALRSRQHTIQALKDAEEIVDQAYREMNG